MPKYMVGDPEATPHRDTTDLIKASREKFKQDEKYLAKLYGTTTCMEGCIVLATGKAGQDNYRERFRDPLEERTLKLISSRNIVLLFKHTVKGLPSIDICDGLAIVNSFSFSRGYEVADYWHKPAELPYYLEAYIAKCVASAFESMKVGTNAEKFFNEHYTKGGMVPFAEVRKHSEWKDSYLQDVDAKYVNMCKSCKGKALKGCCPEYSQRNRKKLKMIIGWS